MVQSKFLTGAIEMLSGDRKQEVLDGLESLRSALVEPANVILYIAGSMKNVGDVVAPLNACLGDRDSPKRP